ncbi:hypothetical protein SMACR_05468 [Sordaria macrospora]|uniref:Autophagy-related protein 29 n=1 Tax=Sordaria macrospora TaxID=5147 RepID=A0A8S8ZC18_SORMA|nr:hypothetical protein SMACR_05468 [Sordaria macrospora]
MSLRERPGSSSNQDRREPRYHVYVRLPFNRGDFVDPPPVSWDDRKSEALWTIISGVSQTEIDCKSTSSKNPGLMLMVLLAVQFDVTVEFLLQMVSYLTERHTAQLRAQMRKAAANGRGSAAPSPIPGGEPVGHAEGMRRAGSIGGRTSALSMRKEALAPKDDVNNSPGTPTAKTSANFLRPAISRNSSQTTLVPGPNPSLAAPVATTSNRIASRLSDSQRRRLSLTSIKTGRDVSSGDATHEGTTEDNRSYRPPESPSPVASTSPSSSSDSDDAEQMQSRYIRRPPRFQSATAQDKTASDDDDDDDELAFLPPARTRQQQEQQQQQQQQYQQPRFQRQSNPTTTGSTSTSDGGGSGALDLHATVTKLPLNYRDHGHPTTPRNRIGSGSGSQQQQQQQLYQQQQQQQVSHGHGLSSIKNNHPQLSTIQSQTSDSSTSSVAIIPNPNPNPNPRRLRLAGGGAGLGAGAGGASGAGESSGARPPGPLSPRRMDMLSREGSEGAPSMGSSFSDLDDASVTQSALEEALASRMQDGTIGSRMSMIGHTIRSKYLPSGKGNRP